MPEFVNPKYADSSRTAFKSPTRLECMMQDLPWLMPPSASISFTTLDAALFYCPGQPLCSSTAALLAPASDFSSASRPGLDSCDEL